MSKHRYSVVKARRDIGSKTEAQVEHESAEKWFAYAVDCYVRHDKGGGLEWLLRAEQYRHEALEHASGAEDGGKLVGEIERRIAKVRPKIVRT